MKINKYFPFVFVYFFVNSLGLPWGLLYTTLLSPLLYLWIVSVRKKDVLLPFLLAFAPFMIRWVFYPQLDAGKLLLSWLNMMGVYIFAQAAYTFVKTCKDKETVFWRILVINFIFCLIALPFYFSKGHSEIFWIEQVYTEGVSHFKRFKLFTYEASYYATLFTPVFFYFFYQIMLKQNRRSWLLLAPLLAIPYVISLSMGVLICVFAALSIVYLVHFASLTRKKRLFNLVISGVLALSVGVLVLTIFFPKNALVVRTENILSGHDISTQGRTSDAFYRAERILEKRDPWWGIAPGQLKIIGADIIRQYYHYQPDMDIITIPNAMAETLLVFGWIGLFARLIIEIGLFFYTKPWRNHFRLALFVFMFFYQFTGSFITSTAEYAVWVLAFTDGFPQFDLKLPSIFKNKPTDA